MEEDENVFPLDITERKPGERSVEVSARGLPGGGAGRRGRGADERRRHSSRPGSPLTTSSSIPASRSSRPTRSTRGRGIWQTRS